MDETYPVKTQETAEFVAFDLPELGNRTDSDFLADNRKILAKKSDMKLERRKIQPMISEFSINQVNPKIKVFQPEASQSEKTTPKAS